MAFNLYPYTDFHEINLDWIIAKIKELGQAFNDFEAVNKITNAGAWDITKQYQAWTVVSDNNIGYISLKPVPVGVAITNTEYWGLIADYDILITDLSNRISTLEGQMTTLNTVTIPGIQNDIININNTNIPNAVNAGIVRSEKFITDQDYILFVGDSYGVITLPSWVEWCADYLGITSSQYKNACVSGTGFAQTTTFYDILSDPDNLALANQVTKIVICGGINDSYSAQLATLATMIQSTITYAHNNYPKANIYVGFIGTCLADAGSFPADVRDRDNQYAALQQYMYGNGYSYLYGVENSIRLRNDLLESDKLHPNSLGLQFIGLGVAKALMTGSFDAAQGNFEGDRKYIIKNDRATVCLKSAMFTPGSSTISSGDSIRISTNTGVYADKPFHFNCMVAIQQADNTIINAMARVSLHEWYADLNFIGNGTITSTAIRVITYDNEFTMPTFYCN